MNETLDFTHHSPEAAPAGDATTSPDEKARPRREARDGQEVESQRQFATTTRPMQRRVSVARHQAWCKSLAGGAPFDVDDDLLEEVPEPSQRRKEGEVGQLLAILDTLGGTEGQP